MNRRGHIPSLFLLIASLVLIGFSIFVFVSFDREFLDNSAEYRGLVGEYSFKKEHVEAVIKNVVLEAVLLSKGKENFNESVLREVRRISGERDVKTRELAGNVYGKLQNGDFDLIELENGEYEIIVSEVFFRSESEGNEMVWRGNFKVRFDEFDLK